MQCWGGSSWGYGRNWGWAKNGRKSWGGSGGRWSTSSWKAWRDAEAQAAIREDVKRDVEQEMGVQLVGSNHSKLDATLPPDGWEHGQEAWSRVNEKRTIAKKISQLAALQQEDKGNEDYYEYRLVQLRSQARREVPE